jgi:uncharacterized protein
MAKPAASIEQQKKIKQLQALTFLQGSLISRISHFGKLGYQFDGDRDLYEALGYKTVLDYDDFYAQYVRQDVARAVIDKPISMTWTGNLQLLESSDDKDTQLELDWTELEKRLHIKSVFARLDRLTSLGHYGILLFGLDDVSTKEVFAQPVKGGKRNLVYVKPLSEASATVLSWDTDPSSPRYGMPTLYQVSVTTPDGSATEDMRVHFSRVLHVPGEGVLENELQGSPRLEVVFNRLKDLEKLVGGSAEMFWRGARPGYQGKVDTDYQMTSDTVEDLQDQIDEYEHNLRRILVNQGVDLQALQSQVADPSSHVDVQIQMISAVTGIPKRILTGSERGELASTQDRDNWFGVIQSRREEYAEPLIVRPFTDRCIELGVLPKAMKEGYSVQWSSLFEQSQEDLANLGKTRVETLKSYSSAPTNQDIIPPDAFLRLMLNLDDDEIELIQQQQEEMAKQEEKDMEEAPPEPEAEELVAKELEEENEKPLTQWDPDQPRDKDGKWTSTGGSIDPISFAHQYGLEAEITPGERGGEYTGGKIWIGDDETPGQAFAGDWTDPKASDFRTEGEYPLNVRVAAHEITHGLFSQDPERGHVALKKFQKLGVPSDVGFESLVDTGGVYLLEPKAITNPKIKAVLDEWLGDRRIEVNFDSN